MMEVMDDRIAIDRGLQAESLLKHPLFQEAFSILEKRLFEAFQDAPARDAEGREYIHKMSKVLKDFRSYFEETVRLGENAGARIRHSENEAKFREYPGAQAVHANQR